MFHEASPQKRLFQQAPTFSEIEAQAAALDRASFYDWAEMHHIDPKMIDHLARNGGSLKDWS